MIAIDSITKLNTIVVYSARSREPGLPGQGLLLGADATGLSQVIDAPEVGPSPEGIALASMRNQLILSVGSNKLQFADHSGHVPARDDFPIRVAHAAEYIGTASNHVYTAIGLNFEVEAKSAGEELPSQALLQRFVKEEALKGTGYDAVGASARLWYAAHDRIHDLRIEPRGNLYDARTYYAGLSTQIVLEGVLPSPEWLSHLLKEVYDDFIEVLTTVLDSRGN